MLCAFFRLAQILQTEHHGNHQEVSRQVHRPDPEKGYPFISRSFVSLTVAKKWAATTEADTEWRLHVVIPDDTTVGELLNRYDRKILPTHKGQRAERYRVQTLLGFFGGLKLIHFTPRKLPSTETLD